MHIKDDKLPVTSGECEISRIDNLYYIKIDDLDGDLPHQIYLHPREFADLCRCINGLTEYN